MMGTRITKKTGDGVFAIEKKLKGNEDICHFTDLEDYLTDLNIPHRVAVKVYGEMQSKITDNYKGIDWDASSHCNTILYALLDLPINGEYITLATATAEAIVYLNLKRETNPQ